jgi:hypothetical protein
VCDVEAIGAPLIRSAAALARVLRSRTACERAVLLLTGREQKKKI